MARRAPTVDLEEVLTEALSVYRGGRHASAPGEQENTAGATAGDGPSSPEAGDEGEDAAAMLEATSRLLATYGLRRWSMEDVAERAGLGRATVYRRFESRERLVRSALVRDARRFFEAVAASVAAVESFEDKVVEGLLTGLDLLRLSPIPHLLRSDAVSAMTLLTSESTLRAGTRALLESYQRLTGRPVPPGEAIRVHAVAETLIRLGISMMLTPGILTGGGQLERSSAGDAEREVIRRTLAHVIGPLVATSR